MLAICGILNRGDGGAVSVVHGNGRRPAAELRSRENIVVCGQKVGN